MLLLFYFWLKYIIAMDGPRVDPYLDNGVRYSIKIEEIYGIFTNLQ